MWNLPKLAPGLELTEEEALAIENQIYTEPSRTHSFEGTLQAMQTNSPISIIEPTSKGRPLAPPAPPPPPEPKVIRRYRAI